MPEPWPIGTNTTSGLHRARRTRSSRSPRRAPGRVERRHHVQSRVCGQLRRRARARPGSRSPCSISSTPSARIAAFFSTRVAVRHDDGRRESRGAAPRTPIDWPWLPRVALMTPRQPGSRLRSASKYTSPPRSLKAPTGVWFSCLTQTSVASACASSGQTYCGVAGTSGAIRRAAASISEREGSVISRVELDARALHCNRCGRYSASTILQLPERTGPFVRP